MFPSVDDDDEEVSDVVKESAKSVLWGQIREWLSSRYTINVAAAATSDDDGRRKVNQFNELISPGD